MYVYIFFARSSGYFHVSSARHGNKIKKLSSSASSRSILAPFWFQLDARPTHTYIYIYICIRIYFFFLSGSLYVYMRMPSLPDPGGQVGSAGGCQAGSKWPDIYIYIYIYIYLFIHAPTNIAPVFCNTSIRARFSPRASTMHMCVCLLCPILGARWKPSGQT